MTMSRFRDGYVQVSDDVTLHYVRWPGGSKGTVVCIHGITANCHWWDLFAEGLRRDYTVFAIDVRGRGDSSKPETGFTLDDYAGDLKQFLDKLNIAAPILMGHSMGAFIAATFMGQNRGRVRAAVMVDGGVLPPAESGLDPTEMIKASLARLDQVYPDLDAYLEPWRTATFIRPSAFVDDIFTFDAMELPAGGVQTKASKAAAYGTLSMLTDYQQDAALRGDLTPVLFLRAPQPVVPGSGIVMIPEAAITTIAELLPNSAVVTVGDTNHYSIMLNDEGVAGCLEAIKPFLAAT